MKTPQVKAMPGMTPLGIKTKPQHTPTRLDKGLGYGTINPCYINASNVTGLEKLKAALGALIATEKKLNNGELITPKKLPLKDDDIIKNTREKGRKNIEQNEGVSIIRKELIKREKLESNGSALETLHACSLLRYTKNQKGNASTAKKKLSRDLHPPIREDSIISSQDQKKERIPRKISLLVVGLATRRNLINKFSRLEKWRLS